MTIEGVPVDRSRDNFACKRGCEDIITLDGDVLILASQVGVT